MEQNNGNNNGRVIAIITMCFIFAMISFVTNMGAPLATSGASSTLGQP